MHSIKEIELNRLVIHGVSNLADEPEIADKEEVLSEGLRHFFEEHIKNSLKTSSAKTAKFNGSDTTVSACTAAIVDQPEDFVEQCKVMGMWFAHQMEKSAQVQTFLAIGLFTDLDTDKRYLGLLKLDPVKAYVKRPGEALSFEEIRTLPDPTRTLLRFAIAQPYDNDSRFDLVFRNCPASPDEDPQTAAMWLDAFLEATEVATPRQMTQLVVKETEKWIEMNSDKIADTEASALRNAVRATAQTEEMDIETIAQAAIKDERQREEYVTRLLDKGLTETSFTPDKDWAERESRRTTYMCDYSVKISGPSDTIDHVVQLMPKTEDRKTRVVIETRKFVQK